MPSLVFDILDHVSRMNRPFTYTRVIAAAIVLFNVSFGQDVAVTNAAAAAISAKREFRGAWIATVTNLDWPPSPGMDPDAQRFQLTFLLDQLSAAGFNAVVFQVRTECDAMYNSPYEPWSYWLSGAQGVAPNPLYDPLQFAAQEAHKRGMEIHAWFNPYRAVRPSSYTKAANHVSNLHPDWLLTFSTPSGTIKILDPGLSAVRDHVAMVVSDIVRRYDIDGIHADDYFYPYPEGAFTGVTNQDDSTFVHFPRGFVDRPSWRRDNVNLLMKQISDSVKALKPLVKFGMSPFGIWQPGNPPGITGLNAYTSIYCDPVTWLQKKYVDYIAPQLYWAFGGGQDYAKLQPWWADSANVNGRHLYTGIATYRIGSGYSISEIPNQINFNRGNPKVQGSIQFRANNVRDNLGGISDVLKADLFLYPAIIPTMNWMPDLTPPNAPASFASTNPAPNSYALQWSPPSVAGDGDTASRYVVYRFKTPSPQQADRDNPRNLVSLVGGTTATPLSMVDSAGVHYYYAAAALDRNNNESELSNVITLGGSIPTQPSLASPLNGDLNFPRGGILLWNKSPNALSYRAEFDSTSNLGPQSMLVKGNLTDTVLVPSGLAAQKTYYWRVAAGNQSGVSGYSVTFSLKAGWPLPPNLLSPVAVSGVSRTPTFVWTRSFGTSFQIKVTNVSAIPNVLVIDTTITDTSYTSTKTLEGSKVFSWRVTGFNVAGAGDISAEGRFLTEAGTFVDMKTGLSTEYSLSQNYPNPFNPVTNIKVSVPRYGRVSIHVYDILGRLIASLVDEELAPGLYTFRFDGASLPSGMYLYIMNVGETRIVKKMMLLK